MCHHSESDGTSGTFYLRGGQFGVCTRNLELLEDETNSFWRRGARISSARSAGHSQRRFCPARRNSRRGIQSNHLRVRGVSFAAFNLFDIAAHCYLGHAQLAEFCRATEVPMVRVVWEGEFRFTLEQLIALAKRAGLCAGRAGEGIVLRPAEETRSLILEVADFRPSPERALRSETRRIADS